MLIALAVTILTPLAILYVLNSLDTFGIQPPRFVIRALVWGGVAFVLSFVIETGVAMFATRLGIILLAAPVIEEVLKTLPLRRMMAQGKLVNAVDGLSFGFEIGLSFGMAENLVYLLTFEGSNTQMMGFAAARVLTSGLMHAVSMGVVGAVAGDAARYSPARQRLAFYGAVLLAILFHIAYNVVVIHLDGAWLLLMALAIGLAGFAIMIVIIQREVRWVQQQVMVMGGDSPALARLVADDPAALTAALDKYKAGLGNEVARKIERYSRLVAQQMLLRSALEGLGRSRHRAAVEAHLRQVNGEIAVLNADIGLFMRVWLGMLVAGDDNLRLTLSNTGVLANDDPLLNMALQLGGRATNLSDDDVQQRKHALSKSQLFGGLTGGDLEDVALMLDQRACVVDETILRYDQPGDVMYLVASGRFRRRIPRPDGQYVPMGDVYPGETFGLTGVLGDGEATADVVCTEPGIVYSMDRANLLGLVHGNPEIALTLLNYLALRVQEWGDLIQQLALPQPVEAPVVHPA